jgi:hypothetical protein
MLMEGSVSGNGSRSGSRSGSVQIITDPDSNPRGPKTYGSYGSGTQAKKL